eukprot:gnl/MRDRNA2_/MRDRNA2_96689_c0_seq1.p1 gnl/MRDRNA2_/MRDRNA2_96689_c0~~gnl/MRDRNA2_/MRDRNA2_96689_c0_seq1.p1  ORF type:complete len:813 (+),score=172.50 gnl/MRDRNA2_/MRDRNA2_96689_c0_seq1:101-2539(+)
MLDTHRPNVQMLRVESAEHDLAPWLFEPNNRGRLKSTCNQEDNFSHPCGGRLTPQNAVAWKVWDHWTKYAGSLMDSGVRAELERLCKKVPFVKTGRGKELPTVLAYCGSDVEDHTLVMNRVEESLADRTSLFEYVVRVGPKQCHTTELAIRSICHAVTRLAAKAGEGSAAPSLVVDASDEECETADVNEVGNEGESGQGKEVCTALDLVHWYKEFHGESTKGQRHIAILVDQAQIIPKDILRSFLSHWSSAACDEGLPVFVLLGMQMKPDGQHDLLEGEVKPGILPLGAFHLFDARSTCISLLEFLASDFKCPVAVHPDLLKWLRGWVDIEGHLALSGLLKVLGVICRHYFCKTPLSCLGGVFTPLQRSWFTSTEEASLMGYVIEAIQANPKLLAELLLALPKDASASTGSLSKKDMLYHRASHGSARALIWRWRICESLDLWKALVSTAEPQSFETPLQRMCRLWNLLWPGKYNAEQSESFQKHLAKLLRRSSEAKDIDLRSLIAQLRCTCNSLRLDLTQQIESVEKVLSQAPGSERQHQIRKAFEAVFSAFCSHGFWQPLADEDARAMFIGFFEIPYSLVNGTILMKLNPTVQASLSKVLEEGCTHEFESHFGKDILSLYRLLELSRGKSVDAEDMWEAFKQAYDLSNEEPASNESEKDEENACTLLRKRFDQGVMALHHLGVVIPKERMRKGDCTGWRLHKRYFGRVWQVEHGPASQASTEQDADAQLNAAATEDAAPTTPPAQVHRQLMKQDSNQLPEKKHQVRHEQMATSSKHSVKPPWKELHSSIQERAASPPFKRRRKERVTICW